jgi:hypothetical protein
MPSKKAGPVVYKFPLKGQVQSQGYASQPLDSAILCQNVMPFDPQTTRLRGGQRAGTTQLQGPIVSSSTRINRLHQVQKVDGTGTRCCATAGAQLWAGADFKTLAVVNATFINSLVNNSAPHSCDLFGQVYFVDGVGAAPKTYNPVANTSGTLAATAGVLPGVARVCANFMGRLCLVVGQDLYFSRAGTPSDFDYSQRDSLAAVATGTSSTYGNIGQPPYALIPFTNDTMIVGCDHSMLLVKGNPADGGTLLTISNSIGMRQKDGWCVSPEGDCYFFGTGGFYRIKAGTQEIENLSVNKMDAFFAQIPNSHNVQMAWDRDKKGCWMFATPFTYPGTTITNVICYWDQRTEGFFPMDFPSQHGPESVIVYDGDVNTDRYLVLGGRDGRLRRYDETAHDDVGVLIYSYVQFAPFRPGGAGQATLTDLQPYLGEIGTLATFNLDWRMDASKDAYNAFAQQGRFFAGTFGPGRNKPLRQRLTGGDFILSLSNQTLSAHWSMEEIYAFFEPAGRQR